MGLIYFDFLLKNIINEFKMNPRKQFLSQLQVVISIPLPDKPT